MYQLSYSRVLYDLNINSLKRTCMYVQFQVFMYTTPSYTVVDSQSSQAMETLVSSVMGNLPDMSGGKICFTTWPI